MRLTNVRMLPFILRRATCISCPAGKRRHAVASGKRLLFERASRRYGIVYWPAVYLLHYTVVNAVAEVPFDCLRVGLPPIARYVKVAVRGRFQLADKLVGVLFRQHAKLRAMFLSLFHATRFRLDGNANPLILPKRWGSPAAIPVAAGFFVACTDSTFHVGRPVCIHGGMTTRYCPVCTGAGFVRSNEPIPCPDCSGSGKVSEELACPACRGRRGAERGYAPRLSAVQSYGAADSGRTANRRTTLSNPLIVRRTLRSCMKPRSARSAGLSWTSNRGQPPVR